MTPRDNVWYKLGQLEGVLSVTPLMETDAIDAIQRQALMNTLDEIEKIEQESPRTVYISATKDILCSCGRIHHVQSKLEVLDTMDAKYTIEGE